jgi:hypothetical protein
MPKNIPLNPRALYASLLLPKAPLNPTIAKVRKPTIRKNAINRIIPIVAN